MRKPRDAGPSGTSDKRGTLTSDLASRIAKAEAGRRVAADGNAPAGTRDMTGMSRAVRLGSEFVAAILVGVGIGYLLDQGLNTRPWLMLVFLLVGFAAGVLNMVRATAEMNRAVPPATGAPAASDDDDEDN